MEKALAVLENMAEQAGELAAIVRKQTINTYTDKHHKKYNTEIAALNAAQNAAGKIIVLKALQAKVETLLKLGTGK